MKTEIHPLRLLIKALLLFILINIIYAVIDPPIYGVSTYNTLFPGRVRFPFGEGSDPYTVAVDNLDVMISSHSIAAPKDVEEYRVVIIGDSSIWGEGLTPEESISEQWNQLNNQCNNRKLKFYNLGYPHPSVVKDLMILDRAMDYDPDMIVWFVTLNTLVPLRVSPFLAANSERATKVLDAYDIPFKNRDQLLSSDHNFYEKTLIGRRSDLARAIKLQTLGLIWSAIGTDTNLYASTDPVPLSPDVKDDVMYKGMKPEDDLRSEILIDALIAGHEIAESRPILIVNEPIFIATGQNKDVRYNDAYPRWAYDYYRDVMNSESEKNQWNYLDLWDTVPVEYFADARFHLSAQGEQLIVQHIHPVLQTIACQ